MFFAGKLGIDDDDHRRQRVAADRGRSPGPRPTAGPLYTDVLIVYEVDEQQHRVPVRAATLATASAAMLPAGAGAVVDDHRLGPHISDSFCAMMRPPMSEPPGAKPTRRRHRLVGPCSVRSCRERGDRDRQQHASDVLHGVLHAHS
jgi:hypothetical protein